MVEPEQCLTVDLVWLANLDAQLAVMSEHQVPGQIGIGRLVN